MTSNLIIPDTSFIIALLTPESSSTIAKNIFTYIQSTTNKLIAPQYLQTEVYTVVRKKVHFKLLSTKHANDVLKVFSNLPITYQSQTKKELHQAFQLATKLKQPTIYDTIFLALAINQQAAYITNDLKFAKQSKKVYKNCLTFPEATTFLS